MNLSQSVTNQQIYEEIIKTRTDLKNSIEASETRLLLKVEELKTRINTLEEENYYLKNKLELLEQSNKKNNIIIFGLKKTEITITPKSICQKLEQLLGIELSEQDINNIYPLGNQENSPIKVEFLNYIKKICVLKNCNKLKGSSISIAHDLTVNQRDHNQKLRKHLNLARKDKSNICYIKRDQLVINGTAYTVDELETEEIQQRKTNSAPSTPTTNTIKVKSTKEATQATTSAQNIGTPKTGAIKKQAKAIPGNLEKPKTRSVSKPL